MGSPFPGSLLGHKFTVSPNLAYNSDVLTSVLKHCYSRHVSPHLSQICIGVTAYVSGIAAFFVMWTLDFLSLPINCLDLSIAYLPLSQISVNENRYVCHSSHHFPLWALAFEPYIETFLHLRLQGIAPLHIPQVSLWLHLLCTACNLLWFVLRYAKKFRSSFLFQISM